MKSVIVTGASSGIGKEIAIGFAKNGYNVCINHIGSIDDANAVKALVEENGVSAICVDADVSNYESAQMLIDETKKAFETVDVLVNNAGITRDALIMRMGEEDFDKVISVNLKGAFNCSKAAVKYMAKQRQGAIVNITSVVGEIGNAGQCNYASSKAGLIGLTKSLAKEMASRNIRVNAVAPGFIETKMTEVLSQETKDEMMRNIALKRFGTPENIAKAVCFLASDDASYITGQVLNVCGGMVM